MIKILVVWNWRTGIWNKMLDIHPRAYPCIGYGNSFHGFFQNIYPSVWTRTLHHKADLCYALTLAGRWAANRERKGIGNIRAELKGLEGALSLKMSKQLRTRRHQCGRLINKHYCPRAQLAENSNLPDHRTHRDELPVYHACSSMLAVFINTDHARAVSQCIWIVHRGKCHLQLIWLRQIFRRIYSLSLAAR